jgi:hypothetical protein
MTVAQMPGEIAVGIQDRHLQQDRNGKRQNREHHRRYRWRTEPPRRFSPWQALDGAVRVCDDGLIQGRASQEWRN